MTLTLTLFSSAVLLELLTHLFGKRRALRRILAVATLITGSFAAGMLVMTNFNVFTVLLALLSLYRVFNMVRIMQERMHEVYLRRATRRTSLALMALQFVGFGLWWVWAQYHTTGHNVWGAAGIVQAVAALLLLLSILRNLRSTMWPPQTTHYSDKELPTVTVAIPARNETEDLQECLHSLVSSDYPKLEILVLDDCSQLKRTPQIIKDFAHAGVRFIQGHEPRETWLPKNQAYDRLAHEASGHYVLFCGVDTRFASHTIRQAISVILERKKDMLSILPRRQRSAYGHLSLIQAMRYWWELALPRRIVNRPPVISSCWIIKAESLKRAGGFASVARSIVPEAHFARLLTKDDAYSFLRSIDVLGLESNKQVADQRNTAIRTRYPQMHRRPEQTAITTLLETFFLLFPFVLAIAGFWVSIGIVAHVAAAVASLLLVLTYELVVRSTRVNAWWFGLIAQPFAIIVDIGLLHYSMWKYELSTVEWKGRNVCIPVMHVVPQLPKE